MPGSSRDFHSKKAGSLARHIPSQQRSEQKAANHPQLPYMDLASHETVYRGDTRSPDIIFTAGFAKKNPTSEITLRSELILGGVSTSLNASIVARKYGVKEGYVYAIYLNPIDAVDFRDPGFNDLEEINALFIPTQKIICAAGPIKDIKDYYLVVGKITQNLQCTVPAHIVTTAMNTMKLHFIVASKSRGGYYEV